jgi:hypothetical protein
MILEQRLGLIQPVLAQRQRSAQQDRIARGGGQAVGKIGAHGWNYAVLATVWQIAAHRKAPASFTPCNHQGHTL